MSKLSSVERQALRIKLQAWKAGKKTARFSELVRRIRRQKR